MTTVEPLLARCLNTLAPCSFETVCQNDAHRDRVEQHHLSTRHGAPEQTPDEISDRLWTTRAEERAVIVQAIEAAAIVNNGQVDLNVVRLLLPDGITPQLSGAVVNVLLRQGRLVPDGWTTNQDRRGRNQGKPAQLYKLVQVAEVAK